MQTAKNRGKRTEVLAKPKGFPSLLLGHLKVKTDLSEFQEQNFKVEGTLGAELVCFCIQMKWIESLTCLLRKMTNTNTHFVSSTQLSSPLQKPFKLRRAN